ncbi:MAG TPA: DNA repair protein RecN [Hypericibacter adhaerens]|uniref:DNA repair protein RecN n=1 Tax=Hypericibacter adhaerens TaxID=2602016 RepID=UPI002CF8B8A8|nr:DNA repair protein RecN [Hypericibacter adhaerens]HWA43414.1 DNA repair protein RecN [Hypericibacter adhaerens]
MLVGLAIRDVVLIDRLDLSFAPGLSVLTGETGAGKSILLDSLGLALGERADAGLLRPGAEQASVTAEFDLPASHPANALLAEQGLAVEPALILRRQLGRDGRSRAFVNDEPVSVGLLKRLGETLVEIASQASQSGLMDSATHRDLLDAFGSLRAASRQAAAHWQDWQGAKAAREAAEARLAAARRDEEFLRHAVTELAALRPEAGEETVLANERSMLMNREKLGEALTGALTAISGDGSADERLAQAQRRLDRIAEKAGDALQPVLAALDRAASELAEAVHALQSVAAALDADPGRLEKVEERLFALREQARKHNRAVEALPALLAEMEAQLEALDDQSGGLAELGRREADAGAAYRKSAEALSKGRGDAARKLDRRVNAELAPLKLEKALFRTRLEALPDAQWGPNGLERVHFEIATMPGAEPGPLGKVASGGELSRLMLALRVVLAGSDPVSTLIFDEVDAGVGGATAAAVGARLKRLADDLQVIVVTHSPQVAALGSHHWRVHKTLGKSPRTEVEPLDDRGRREEIARMLSGAKVTDEARAAADRLMAGTA